MPPRPQTTPEFVFALWAYSRLFLFGDYFFTLLEAIWTRFGGEFEIDFLKNDRERQIGPKGACILYRRTVGREQGPLAILLVHLFTSLGHEAATFSGNETTYIGEASQQGHQKSARIYAAPGPGRPFPKSAWRPCKTCDQDI